MTFVVNCNHLLGTWHHLKLLFYLIITYLALFPGTWTISSCGRLSTLQQPTIRNYTEWNWTISSCGRLLSLQQPTIRKYCYGNWNDEIINFLYQNQLSGCILEELGKLKDLALLLLYKNQLTCSIEDIFSVGSYQALQTVDIRNNRITGGIPSSLFRLPQLNSLSLAGNCFSITSLPDTVCNASSLSSLILDGLHSSTSCLDYIFGPSSNINTYQAQKILEGNIPACVFTLPNMTTLHMSWNGITGSISSVNSLAVHLVDLSLSNNILTDSIPNSIQERNWTQLDLSNNRLSGTLQSSSFLNLISDSALFLHDNRLSGSIPATIKNTLNISVLTGNLFGCDYERSSLPIQRLFALSFIWLDSSNHQEHS